MSYVYSPPLFYSPKSLYYNRFCAVSSLVMTDSTLTATINSLAITVSAKYTTCKFPLGERLFHCPCKLHSG